MKYRIPTNPEAVGNFWPDRIFVVENGVVMLPEGVTPLTSEEIEHARFEIAKRFCDSDVRAAALEAADTITKIAVGTADMRQMYIYGLKREEADWLIQSGAIDELQDPATTNERTTEILNNVKLLSREALDTSVTVPQLALAVIEQFKLSQSHLHEHLGRIEGIRRNTIQLIISAESFADLDAIPELEWIDPAFITPF